MAKDRNDSRHGQTGQQLMFRFELVETLQPGESALAKIIDYNGLTDDFLALSATADRIRVHATFYRSFGFTGERGWASYYPDHDTADDGTQQWEVTSLEGSLLRPGTADADIAAAAAGDVTLVAEGDDVTVSAQNHSQTTVKEGDKVTVFYYPYEEQWYIMSGGGGDGVTIVKVTGTTAGEGNCTWTGKVTIPNEEAAGYCTNQFADGADCLLVVLNSANGSVSTGTKAQLQVGELYLAKKVGRISETDVYAIRIENTFIHPVTLSGSVADGASIAVTIPTGSVSATNKSGQTLSPGNATAYRNQTDLAWYLTGAAAPSPGTTEVWHAFSEEEIMPGAAGDVLLPDVGIGVAGVVSATNWSNFSRILTEQRVLCWQDPTDDLYYCIADNYAELVRFELTANKMDSTTGAAKIREWDGAAYVDGSAITVKDPTERSFTGLTGARGWALRMKDHPEQFEIVWMESYAPSANFLWATDNTAILSDTHGETGPDTPVDLVDPDGFFSPRWEGPAVAIYDHDDNRFIAVQAESFAGAIRFTMSSDVASIEAPCKTVNAAWGTQTDTQDPTNGDIATNPVEINRWGYEDTKEDAEGIAIFSRTANVYRAVVINQKPMFLWARADSNFLTLDTSLDVKDLDVISPFPFNLDVEITNVENPLQLAGTNNDRLLLAYDANTQSYYLLASIRSKSARIFYATLVSALESADTYATIYPVGAYALDGGPVTLPTFNFPAFNPFGLSGQGDAGCLIIEDWFNLTEDDEPTYIVFQVKHIVVTVVTALRYDAGTEKWQQKTQKITVMWEEDKTDWVDLAAQPENSNVTVVSDVDYDSGDHKFKKKTRTVRVQSPGGESAWTAWHDAVESLVVTDVSKSEGTVSVTTTPVYVLEEGSPDTVPLLTFDSVNIVDNVYMSGGSLYKSITTGYVLDAAAPSPGLVFSPVTVQVVATVTDEGGFLQQTVRDVGVWTAAGGTDEEIIAINTCDPEE
jgi:hypothetical protein